MDQLEPSRDELLRVIFRHVDDSMLLEIARADYGEDCDEHLEQLQQIKSGKILAPMRWEPKEVLELIRWSEPEDPTWSPGSTGDRGHWMRLFACTALLRAAAERENEGYFTGEDSTIIQLVDSAIKLGEETVNAAVKFLSWCIQARPIHDCNRPYFALAILILLSRRDQPDPETFEFLEWATPSRNLERNELFNSCQKRKTWQRLIREWLVDSSHASSVVQNFGTSLMTSDDPECDR